MRRYWQPVCLSADLNDLPKAVRILGEEFVAFRDGQCQAGLLFLRRSHCGASLEYGRVEEAGCAAVIMAGSMMFRAMLSRCLWSPPIILSRNKSNPLLSGARIRWAGVRLHGVAG